MPANEIPVAGLVLLNKPKGMSSFQCLANVKRIINSRRVGHIGTIDPFATGLLGVVTQNCTRLARVFAELPKSYVATIQFGLETDTLDTEGQVIQEGPVPSKKAIAIGLRGLIGRIQQRPPDYSAIKLNGKRAYSIARSGGKPNIPLRSVTVYSAECISWNNQELVVNITVSAGTYIRAWARDLGKAAESCAHLVRLERTAIGPFRLAEAIDPSDFTVDDVLPPRLFMRRIPYVHRLRVRPEFRHALLRGQRIRNEFFTKAPLPGAKYYSVFDDNETLLALVRPDTKTGIKVDDHDEQRVDAVLLASTFTDSHRPSSYDPITDSWSYLGVFTDV